MFKLPKSVLDMFNTKQQKQVEVLPVSLSNADSAKKHFKRVFEKVTDANIIVVALDPNHDIIFSTRLNYDMHSIETTEVRKIVSFLLKHDASAIMFGYKYSTEEDYAASIEFGTSLKVVTNCLGIATADYIMVMPSGETHSIVERGYI